MADRATILLVDDDPVVLRAVERDVRARYAARYRVVAVESGAAALDTLDRLTTRGDQVAVAISDQRMPAMTGTDLLEEVGRRSPSTIRVLLTAYADTDAAISAINRAGVAYYILKPWDPPEEKLYPVVDDLLEEWEATGRRAPEGGVRLVGDRWSADAHRLREFLSRNLVPYAWVEVGRHPDADRLVDAAGAGKLPVVVLEDGRVLVAPTPSEVATALGMTPSTGRTAFDLVVVGAGPAGLAAAVYGASEGLSTAIVEAEAPGGQAGTSSRIENYLGFPHGVSGAELTRRAHTQAMRLGATFVSPRRAVRLDRRDPFRVVELDDGTSLTCSAAIIATGVQYRELAVEGAADLAGKGVYYGAATTEAASVVGEVAVVVGGANSAGQGALHLAAYAKQVLMVVRADDLESRMSAYLVERILAHPAIEVRLASEVTALLGTDHIEAVDIVGPGVERERIETSAVFVFIGARPRTEWLDTVVARDDYGFILSGADLTERNRWSLERNPLLLETSIPGVFAVGDVRSRSVKRVATAVGEGAVAVHLVHAYLAQVNGGSG
jgi:thioredoxin reductase (NADPH)